MSAERMEAWKVDQIIKDISLDGKNKSYFIAANNTLSLNKFLDELTSALASEFNGKVASFSYDNYLDGFLITLSLREKEKRVKSSANVFFQDLVS